MKQPPRSALPALPATFDDVTTRGLHAPPQALLRQAGGQNGLTATSLQHLNAAAATTYPATLILGQQLGATPALTAPLSGSDVSPVEKGRHHPSAALQEPALHATPQQIQQDSTESQQQTPDTSVSMPQLRVGWLAPRLASSTIFDDVSDDESEQGLPRRVVSTEPPAKPVRPPLAEVNIDNNRSAEKGQPQASKKRKDIPMEPCKKAKPLWSKSEEVAVYRAAWSVSSEWGTRSMKFLSDVSASKYEEAAQWMQDNGLWVRRFGDIDHVSYSRPEDYRYRRIGA